MDFGILIAYQILKVHFCLFVTFHIILGINICLTRSGDLVFNKLFPKYWLRFNILSPRRDHTRTGNQISAIVILIPLKMLTPTLSSTQFGHFCLKDKFNEHRRPVDKTNIKSKPTNVYEHFLSHSDNSYTDMQLISLGKIHFTRDSVRKARESHLIDKAMTLEPSA